MCDLNLTPPNYYIPPKKTFFTNIHLLQFITTPKVVNSGELPIPYMYCTPYNKSGENMFKTIRLINDNIWVVH